MNFKFAAAGAMLAFALGTTAAFADYPERPMTLIVPWSAGGGTDATGRIIAAMLEEKLGEPVNVVNRTGGGGIVGHTAIKEADPDGYTLGIITTEVSMYEPVGSADITYDDFTLIGLYNADPSAIFVRADSPYKTIEDLAAAVKDDPSAVQASGANFGGLNHLSWVSLVDGIGADAGAAAWIPTDGAAPSLQLLASGAIDAAVSQFPEAKALMDAGEIRALGYLGPERNAAYPDVPTANEALDIDFAIGGWRGLGAPKGIPEEAKDKLLAAMEEIVASDAFREQMGKLNYGVVWEGGADFEAYLAQRGKAFGKAIDAAKIANSMAMRVNRGDLALGLAFALLGAGIAIKAAELPTMGKLPVGSGMFPTLTGIGMVIFGLILALGAVLRGGAVSLPASNMLRWDVLIILVMLAALVGLMPSVGFLVTGAVFAAGAARLGGAGWLGSAVFGVGATAALYGVFVHALGVPLPRGILGF